MKVHARLRPARLLRQRRADQRDVLVDGRILHDAEALADLGADVFADRPLLGLGDDEVVELLLLLLRLLESAAKATKLRGRRAGDSQHGDHDNGLLHTRAPPGATVFASVNPESAVRPTTSNIDTACDLPLTTTSPKGRMS